MKGYLSEEQLIPIATACFDMIEIEGGEEGKSYKISRTQDDMVKKFFKKFDTDQNGVITLDEFCAFMKFLVCRTYLFDENLDDEDWDAYDDLDEPDCRGIMSFS